MRQSVLLSTQRVLFLVVSLGVFGASCSAKDRTFVDVTGGGTGGTGASGGSSGEPLGGDGNDPAAGAAGIGGTDTGGEGGVGGQPEGGMGGAGGEPPEAPSPGKPGITMPAGGILMKSPNFILVSTTGEGPGGQLVMSSQNFKLAAGLVGATQQTK